MSDKFNKGLSKGNGKSSNYIKLVLCGLAGSGIFFLLLSVFSFLTLKFAISDSWFMPLGLISGVISGLFSGYNAVRPVMQKGLLFGSLSGFICILVCGILAFAINGGKAGYGIIILSALILVSSAAGGIAAVGSKPKRKR